MVKYAWEINEMIELIFYSQFTILYSQFIGAVHDQN